MAKESKKATGVKSPVVDKDKVVREGVLEAPEVKIKEKVIPEEIKEPEKVEGDVQFDAIEEPAPEAKEPEVEEVVVKKPKACKKCSISYGNATCRSCVEYKK